MGAGQVCLAGARFVVSCCDTPPCAACRMCGGHPHGRRVHGRGAQGASCVRDTELSRPLLFPS